MARQDQNGSLPNDKSKKQKMQPQQSRFQSSIKPLRGKNPTNHQMDRNEGEERSQKT